MLVSSIYNEKSPLQTYSEKIVLMLLRTLNIEVIHCTIMACSVMPKNVKHIYFNVIFNNYVNK